MAQGQTDDPPALAAAAPIPPVSQAARPAGSGGRGLALTVGLLILVVGASYLPTLDGYFVGDDFGYSQLFWSTPLGAFPRLLAADWSQGIWQQPLDELRPMVALSFRLNTLLSGLNPVGYHLFNLAAHLAATLLVLAVARRLIRATPLRAGAAALLFAVLPVHAELVGWISGRVDVMATAFALLTILGYGLFRAGRGPGWYALAVAALALALFTKEAAISFILLLPAWDLLVVDRPASLPSPAWPGVVGRAMLRWLPFALVLALYVELRHVAFPNALREGTLTPAHLAEFLTRQPYYFAQLLLPLLGPLDSDVIGPSGSPATWLGGLVLAGFIALCLFGLLARRLGRTARLALFFGPAWYLVTTLPLIVTYPSVRHLYLPSAGLCLLVACLPWLDERGPLRRRGGLLRAALLAVLVAGWGALLWRQIDSAEIAANSRAMHREIVAALARLPDGSRVVLVPEVNRGERWLWRWALPFALQPPFTSEDTYRRLDLIELPEAYCCPVWDWWHDREPLVQDWLADPASPTTLLVWDAPNHALIQRQFPNAELRARLARLRAGDGASPLTGPDALRLMADLDPNPGTQRD